MFGPIAQQMELTLGAQCSLGFLWDSDGFPKMVPTSAPQEFRQISFGGSLGWTKEFMNLRIWLKVLMDLVVSMELACIKTLLTFATKEDHPLALSSSSLSLTVWVIPTQSFPARWDVDLAPADA